MRHLELHILQSVPVACLNRDDFGSPKSAIFGNVPRARVSSQCWKRAIRQEMFEEEPTLFAGHRSRLIIEPLIERLKKRGLSDEEARQGAEKLGEEIAKLDKPAKKGEPTVRVKTLFFSSPEELDKLASEYAENKNVKGAIKTLKKQLPADAADIALFGRMVASDYSLTVEGAAMFSHALSTHRVSNEIDFFSAIDDLKPEDAEDAGAGMTGTLEFNSATYYRFAAVNLDMLKDSAHLGGLTSEERQLVVKTFIKATITAIPNARHNSMHAATLPSYVLAVVREKGHPIQLVNAFEEPIWNKSGLIKESIKHLEDEYKSLKTTWGIEALTECRLPDLSLAQFLAEVTRHVE